MSVPLPCLVPDHPLSPGVCVLSTLRQGGVSAAPFGAQPEAGGGLNLGLHCGDALQSVTANRAILGQALPGPPRWLEQVHGSDVVVVEQSADLSSDARSAPPRADAAVTRHRGEVLAVLTADCLPVVLADRHARAIGIAHAGWRGLAAGVLENTLAAMLRLSGGEAADCVAWLGPAIGPAHFEVGLDVHRAFCADDPGAASAFRASSSPGKWWADLPALARRRLRAAGVTQIQGGRWCTFADAHRFFSYRRDRVTGRMATLAWMS